MSVSWGFIFIVVGWKGDYKVVGMDRDKFYFIVILWKYDYKAAGMEMDEFYFYCYFVEVRL